MSKKRSKRPHGHYYKICGEYKSNEKFSGKGHAAHICKNCSKLSATEKAEAMTINRLMDLPINRLSANDKKWLENRVHDHRPEVASVAREVYRMHFPYAERNERKKHLLINTLTFELNNVTVYDEFGDELSLNMRFTANRLTNVLTMIDLNANSAAQSIVLEKKQMAKLLRWTVHTLEIFMWPEDYDLSPDNLFFAKYILIRYRRIGRRIGRRIWPKTRPTRIWIVGCRRRKFVGGLRLNMRTKQRKTLCHIRTVYLIGLQSYFLHCLNTLRRRQRISMMTSMRARIFFHRRVI